MGHCIYDRGVGGVADAFRGIANIGNDGQCGNAHTAMPGRDDFRDSGHPDEVCPYPVQEQVFGGCFQVGPCQSRINAFVERHSEVTGGTMRGMTPCRVIGCHHIGEPRPHPLVIDTSERIVGHQIDVIAQKDQITGVVVGVESTGGIGNDHALTPQPSHGPNGMHDGGHGPAFVVVKTARQADDGYASQETSSDLPGVAFDACGHEMRNFAIGNAHFDGEQPGGLPPSRPQGYGQSWTAADRLLQPFGRFSGQVPGMGKISGLGHEGLQVWILQKPFGTKHSKVSQKGGISLPAVWSCRVALPATSLVKSKVPAGENPEDNRMWGLIVTDITGQVAYGGEF